MGEMDRIPLPPRRLSETRKVVGPREQSFFLTVGYDPAAPTEPREVFYSDGFRSGSDQEFNVSDACVLISLLLQRGATLTEIARSLSKHETPSGTFEHGSVVGWIVENLKERPAWAEDYEAAKGEPLLPGLNGEVSR